MLEARGLRKTYAGSSAAIEAVAEVDLQVSAGEFVAIMGRSGSGKSTLLAMLGGQSRPSAGNVHFRDHDIWAMSADARADYRCKQIGYVFQFAGLMAGLRVIDNVVLPALLAADADLWSSEQRAAELLHRVGLGDRLEAYPGELSGGQQRRVALARALIHRPPLILADEPTAELDADSEREILATLIDLHRQHGTALVIVTHSAAIAAEADRVVHLEAGRVSSIETVLHPPTSRSTLTEPTRVAGETLVPAVPVALGSGWGTLAATLAGWIALAALFIVTANYGAALWQRRAVETRRDERRRLEEIALQQIRADVADITYSKEGSYHLALFAQNLQPDQDVYLMTPTVRVFVQSGRDWKEVPAEAVSTGPGVMPLTRTTEFRYTFRPTVKDFEEQLAGYMHVRITASMVIALQAQPRGDLFERVDDYYVYLKPHGADDAEIARRNGWATKPPLWIPMPAH